MLLLFIPCHEIEGDTVRNDRCGIEERAGIRAKQQVVDKPWNKRECHQEFEMHRVFQINEDDIDGADNEGDKTQKSLMIEGKSHHQGCRCEKDLPKRRELTFIAKVVTPAGKNIAHSAGIAAQEEHAYCLH